MKSMTMYWEREVKETTNSHLHFQITAATVSYFIGALMQNDLATDKEKGYKEQHDLVVVYRSNEPDNGDEQQEDAHCDDPSDDVDARHQAEPFAPCCYSDQQQPDQLKGAEGRKLTRVS